MATENTESFIIKESASEPQVAFDITTRTPAGRDENGAIVRWNTFRYLGICKVKQRVIEARGYTRDTVPAAGSSMETKPWHFNSTAEDGSVYKAGEGVFHPLTVTVERQRINEADMWRATKTVTIKALYINGTLADGYEDFPAGYDTI